MSRVNIFGVVFYVFAAAAITFMASPGKDFLTLPTYNFQQQTEGSFDLTTIAGRENASVNKPTSAYTIKKCGEVKHTDGQIMTICIVDFNGTTGGFYNPKKELMVVGSFDQYVLIHEITHATTLHFYKKGIITDLASPEIQEKMAYNAENLLMQIKAFQEDMDITPDLSDEKKTALGLEILKTTQPKATTKVLSSVKIKPFKKTKELAKK